MTLAFWMTLLWLILCCISDFVYNCCCNICSNPEKMFLKVPHYSSSTHKTKVHFNNCFSYDAPKLWNDLQLEIQTVYILSRFKIRLKTYLFQKPFPPLSFRLPKTDDFPGNDPYHVS